MNKKVNFFLITLVLFTISFIIPTYAETPRLTGFNKISIGSQMYSQSATRGEIEYGTRRIESAAFYPLGWSKDGKLAYVFTYIAEGLGAPVWNYYIQNMVTDSYEFTLAMNGEDFMGTQMDPEYLPPDFAEAIKTTDIILDRNIQLEPFPVIKNDEAYSAHLEGFIFREAGHMYGDILESFYVRVKKSDGTSKIVHQYEDPDSGLFDVQILGCLMSPYENRVAVALGPISYGWEAVLELSVYFVGSHLQYGFSMDKRIH